MGEIPRDIPEQEKFSTSAERSEFMSAANFDPAVEEAVAHMEAHEVNLDSEQGTPLDRVLDEYNETLKLLQGNVEPATRTRLESQLAEIQEKIRGTDKFDRQLERELVGAEQREDKLQDKKNTLETKHPLKDDRKPVDSNTPQAELFLECRRLVLLADTLLADTNDAIGSLSRDEQPKELLRLENLTMRRLNALNELAEHQPDSRYPEKISADVWESSMKKLQDVFEEILLTNRDVMDRTKFIKNQPPQGSIQKRPS